MQKLPSFARVLNCALLALTLISFQSAGAADVTKPRLAPLPLQLPKPVLKGTPEDIKDEHLEPWTDKPRAPVLVPAGVVNLALHKPVSSSDPRLMQGDLSLITNGDKESTDESYVQLHRKLQWVQLDLGESAIIHAIVIWHSYGILEEIYRDVVVQVSDDPLFIENVQTVFNNDFDGSAGLGIGSQKEYFEKHEGRLIQLNAVRARYVRAYSQGSRSLPFNRYIEIEVYGLPMKTGLRAAN